MRLKTLKRFDDRLNENITLEWAGFLGDLTSSVEVGYLLTSSNGTIGKVYDPLLKQSDGITFMEYKIGEEIRTILQNETMVIYDDRSIKHFTLSSFSDIIKIKNT